MTAYAVAHMRHAAMGPQIVEYLHKIDATLDPFGGRFLIHGGDVGVVENDWPGQAILALRTDNSVSDEVFADGVEHPHKATDVLR